MANQAEQLMRLLRTDGADVELVRVNSPYRPRWIGSIMGLRAVFRLVPYVYALWGAIGRASLVHLLANSGWSWHLFASPAVWISRLRGKAIVVNYRGGEAERFFAKSWRWVSPTIRRATAVIVPSGYLQEVFRKRGIEAGIVPNVVDLNRFSPSEKAGQQESAVGWPHIVVARNLERIYDTGTALRAVKAIREHYPGARLTVLGAGPELAALEALAGELGIAPSTEFAGRVDNAQVARIYKTADLMLNPSLVDNMPISILEALASGVPVVSTNVGGIPHLVTSGETALLVPPGDPDRMADAALSLLQDPELSQRLIESGLELASRFQWGNVREGLSSVYRRVLEVDPECETGRRVKRT